MSLISIVVPAYNAEKYIAETIQSILDQTHTEWELFIVDDGSKDATAAMVKPFLSDSRIHYIFQQNAGVSVARNTGIDFTTGEYLAFLDADDYWLPQNLEKKLQSLTDSGFDWSYSDAWLADATLNKTAVVTSPDKAAHERYLMWETPIVFGICSNALIKRKCFANGLRFDPRFSTAADQDFAFYLSKDYHGIRVPEPLWLYRVLENSMSRNIAVMEKDHIGVFEKAREKQLFQTAKFRRVCFSRLYLILAGSWWVNGNSKIRAGKFLFLSFITYPPTLIQRAIRKP